MPEEPQVEADPLPPDPPGNRRRRVALASFAVLVLLAGAVVGALRSDEPAAAPTTTTTTTTSTTTTSTTTAPARHFEIATAKPSVPLLHVRAKEPEGWSTTPVTARGAPLPPPPASEPALPPRPALPRADHPIIGRYAVEDGWVFENPGPYEPKQPFTMAVLERRGAWAKVMVPVRPNNTHGWVALSHVDLTTTSHRVEIRLGERTLKVWDGSELVIESPIVVGSEVTPTPTGAFFVTDVVPQANPAGAYGPVALALDAYSEVMDRFDTGVPVIALHGTNRPEQVGQAISNGCIRMPNDVISQLVVTLPRGAPVHIWP